MDDLISRQAAINAVRHSPIIEVQPAYMLIDKADVLKNLIMVPSAQRTGRWIIKENPGTEWYRVTCSACGEDVSSVIPTIGFFPNVKALWDFCPECGARMNGGDDGGET